MTLTTRCVHCGKQLPTKDFALPGHKPMLITLPCDCDKAKEDAEREERERIQRERMEAFSKVWRRSGVPDRFLHVKADFDGARPLHDGKSVYIVGKSGRGKTQRACEIAKAYLVKHTYSDNMVTRCWKSFMFVTAHDMLERLKNSWNMWDESEEWMFKTFTGVGLLLLDDLGKGVPSEWAAENMLRLVDARWSKGRPIIITSQYTPDGLSERYEKADEETMEAMMSRLDGWCHGIISDGPDYRTKF